MAHEVQHFTPWLAENLAQLSAELDIELELEDTEVQIGPYRADTPSGRMLAGMLAVFAEFERDILQDRVKAGIEQARKDGKPHGRPMTAGKLVGEMKQLRKEGLSKREIVKRLGVSRTSSAALGESLIMTVKRLGHTIGTAERAGFGPLGYALDSRSPKV